MNVWVVSFDESEDASDPLLRAFGGRLLMEHAVKMMAHDTPFYDQIREALDDGGDFTLILWDDEADQRMQIHVRSVTVEQVEAILAKGAL